MSGWDRRAYFPRANTQQVLAAKLDEGFVLIDLVRGGGPNGTDVGYFRKGTEAEIADCRQRMIEREPAPEVCDHCGRATNGRVHLPQGGYCVLAPLDAAPSPEVPRE